MIDHTKKSGYTRGLDKLDKILSRPDNSELITIYAGGGVGKTEFTYFVARANADRGVKVCYLSLEMPLKQLALRYAVKRAGIKSYIDYQDKNYTTVQGEMIEKYYKEFTEYKNINFIGDEKEYTLKNLINEDVSSVGILNEYYDKGYRIFIIDNLGKIHSDKQEWDSQAEISHALQSWKNKYNCCVMLIHHTTGTKNDVRMRGSKKIFDCSTKVIQLLRDNDPTADGPDKARLTIKQEKNSIRGDYIDTECYFDRGVYVEEYVGNLYKSKKLQDFDDTSKDEVF